MKKKEFSLINKIFKATQDELLQAMSVVIGEYYPKDRVIACEDYIVAIGDEDTPVALVAHLDTVHKRRVVDLFYDRQQNVMWSPQGLGADDRAGVYAILKIISRGYKPTIIFTTDEEIGGLGARALIEDFPSAPCDLKFIVELDRRGEDDCVFYSCNNVEFETHIEKYGFKTSIGSFSDISYICPTWGVAGTNLSIGYDDEHTLYERLYINHMNSTIEKVCSMLDDINIEAKVFEYVEVEDYYNMFMKYYGDGYYQDGSNLSDDSVFCWDCLTDIKKDNAIETPDRAVYCVNCYEKRYTTCISCAKVFSDITKTHIQCSDCRNLHQGEI